MNNDVLKQYTGCHKSVHRLGDMSVDMLQGNRVFNIFAKQIWFSHRTKLIKNNWKLEKSFWYFR